MSIRNISSNSRKDKYPVFGLGPFLSQESLSRFRFSLLLFIFFAGFGLLFQGESTFVDPPWMRSSHLILLFGSYICSYKVPIYKKYSEYILLFHFSLMSAHSVFLLYVNGLYLGYLFGMILVIVSTGIALNKRKLHLIFLLIFLPIAIAVGANCPNPTIERGMYYFGIISSTILAVLVSTFQLRTIEKLVEADLQLEKYRANMESELELAQSTQKSLVDLKFPQVGPFRMYSYFNPLEGVGGDLIKSEKGQNGQLDFFFADAAGHGISAAMVSSMAVMAFKMISTKANGPAHGLFLIHESLMTMIGGFFITAVYLRLNPVSLTLSYAYAGHHPGILIQKDGMVEELAGKGTVLLALPKLKNQDYVRTLHSGDRVLLMSDGLFEFFTKEKEFFGYSKFMDLVRENSNFSGDAFLQSLGDAVNRLHVSKTKDDQTMLLIEVA
ncbi:serine/threonine protein phosphatase [Leptospira perolatii]|uniref:Serine/threonine protein phosphatase n=1 Tax=Leptospira perolatii TaxID=2023191 RepID=A0A2M9ZN76_9LEPT|nr:PP2C family protein-serine/threonine phosphatase [Leptospira perolatii]PJZ68953.1 serine/threonine protein phosphatase [Leptospira perolatii]PJZ73429.1 serine/threonine protein phosphatase [Leptospira perolatii]